MQLQNITRMNRKSILEMSHKEAKDFFLKDKSYCSIDLPKYFLFSKLLGKISKAVDKENNISQFYSEKKLKNCEEVNHLLFANKDGKLSWRPLQIIHPFLYVLLVKEITEESNWKKLRSRFGSFQRNEKIKYIKDLAAGGVLFASLIALAVGILIFVHHLF